MNKEEFRHKIIFPLAQLIKSRNAYLKKVVELDDKITQLLDKEHIDMMSTLSDSPKDSVINKELNET